jgi:hypothetical protein
METKERPMYEVLITKNGTTRRYTFSVGSDPQRAAYEYACMAQEMADWGGYTVEIEVKEIA